MNGHGGKRPRIQPPLIPLELLPAIDKWRSEGHTLPEIAKALGVGYATARRASLRSGVYGEKK